MTIILSVFVIILALDILISDLSLVLGNFSWTLPVFVLFVISYFIIQRWIFAFVKRNIADLRKNNFIQSMSSAMTLLQYVMIFFLSYVILSILATNAYETWVIMLLIGMSYGATIFIFSLLAFRFLKWYLSNKNFFVLMYFVVSLVIAIRIIAILPFYEDLLAGIPNDRLIDSAIPEYDPDLSLNGFYGISSGVAIILLWISAVTMVHHYHKKISRSKYYIIITVIAISAAYSMSDFVLTPALEAVFGETEYWVFTAFQGVLTGIALGAPFWAIGSALRGSSRKIGNFMLLCGFAFCIFITSGSAIIDHAPFPPFGIIAVISMQMSAFILFVALYASAVSASEDINLRNLIRKNFYDQAGFIERMGSAEMEEDLIKRTLTLSKNEAKQYYTKTGIKATISDTELIRYAGEVLNEIKNITQKSP